MVAYRSRLLQALALALLLAVAQAADRAIDEPEDDDEVLEEELDYSERLASFQRATEEASRAAKGGELIPEPADEWYTVTIADVSVGYMHTTTVLHPEDAKGDRGPGVTTTELMDVQVSRGTDTSRMAFETAFTETGLDPKDTTAMPSLEALRGGVKVMAYDQRFSGNEVRMNVSITEDGQVPPPPPTTPPLPPTPPPPPPPPLPTAAAAAAATAAATATGRCRSPRTTATRSTCLRWTCPPCRGSAACAPSSSSRASVARARTRSSCRRCGPSSAPRWPPTQPTCHHPPALPPLPPCARPTLTTCLPPPRPTLRDSRLTRHILIQRTRAGLGRVGRLRERGRVRGHLRRVHRDEHGER